MSNFSNAKNNNMDNYIIARINIIDEDIIKI